MASTNKNPRDHEDMGENRNPDTITPVEVPSAYLLAQRSWQATFLACRETIAYLATLLEWCQLAI